MGRATGIGGRVAKGAGYVLAGVAGLALLAGAGGWTFLQASLPQLEGTAALDGLGAAVQVERDAGGIATITAENREDLARALGFLHAQERFFQMDLLRRSAAGELAELAGAAALPIDRKRRIHRFRARAAAEVARMEGDELRVAQAYVAGVNAGLDALGAMPMEYGILRQVPRPWTPEDTVLAVWAMYFDLQDSDGAGERLLADAQARLGPELAAFLYPIGTDWDAPIDGVMLPPPPLPSSRPAGLEPAKAAHLVQPDSAETAPGSNNWGVAGALTEHGAALVADDMHLGLSVPNTWYRARLIVQKPGTAPELDITGVTLPGTPTMIAGSNGWIAWGYTNSYIDTGDLVILEPSFGEGNYKTPDGPKTLTVVTERICASNGDCEDLAVEESVWGPVVARDATGNRLAYRWVAHDPGAVRMGPTLEMERARSVPEAVAIAHRSGIPNQNLMVGDRDGNLAWTIMGRVPKRIGFDGRVPTSWASGANRWDGYLAPEEVPVVLNPEDDRLWTANSRVMGGDALARLGEGGYAHGARARQIRDALFAKDRFTPADMLAIQLDDRGTVLDRWQGLMLEALRARAGADPTLAAMVPVVEAWSNRAVPDNVAYRLVRTFRFELLTAVYGGFMPTEAGGRRVISGQADAPAWTLVSERPAHLVPPGFATWDAVIDHALSKLRDDIAKEAGGDVSRYSWGARNMAAIGHPLSRFIPGLGKLTDAPAEPLHGDTYQPRAQGRSFGASQRFAVSPGREAEGLFHMPGSQSGHPLSPYYLVGHDDWVQGRPTPFLPGATVWTLRLVPTPG